MWNVVSQAAISVSAALEELWFGGDLLGIFFLSVLFFFFELGFFLVLSLVCGSAAVDSLDAVVNCGRLMGFRRCLPLM